MNELANTIKKYNHICWYPSAGADYRALLYLSKAFYDDYSVLVAGGYPDHDRYIPDLFIYTDVNIPEYVHSEIGTFKSGTDGVELNDPKSWKKARTLHYDKYTRITIESISRFKGVIKEFKSDRVESEYGISDNYGDAFMMTVKVESEHYPYDKKVWTANLLYVIAENTVAAKELFLDNNITVDSVVQIRYGDGYSDAGLKAQWVKSLFRHLGTQYFIANDNYVTYYESVYKKDTDFIKEYFAPYDLVKCPEFEIIYQTDGKQWSSYGPVNWCKVNY